MIVGFGRLLFRYRSLLFPLAVLPVMFVVRPHYPFGSARADRILDGLGLGLALAGQALRVAVIGLAYIKRGGKDRRIHADSLVQEGIFAHSRNPLYVGNVLVFAGLFVVLNSWAGYLVGFPAIVGAYFAIVRAEEEFLASRFGAAYQDYCRQVPRFFPRLRGLRQTLAGMRFEWKRVLRKEYGSTFAWLSTAMCLLVWERVANEGVGSVSLPARLGAWLLLFAGYVAVRLLKKRKRLEEPKARRSAARKLVASLTGHRPPR